jgi:hypothetical protein
MNVAGHFYLFEAPFALFFCWSWYACKIIYLFLAFDFKTPWCNGWSDDLNYRRPCAKQKQSLSFCLLIIALFVLLFMSSAYTCCIYTVFFSQTKRTINLIIPLDEPRKFRFSRKAPCWHATNEQTSIWLQSNVRMHDISVCLCLIGIRNLSD